ncbi:hypothetical protein EKN40_20825 [Enterobacter hormaechei]|nr:hypothetical protein EKN36_20635 [Enterobacter hormaechei]RTP71456.1 hypothetical protein EKN40_20825 [Enterobacter hormaechei]
MARNALPAPPARLRGLFQCRCKSSLRPHQSWRWRGRPGRENACKTMHLTHAWLNSGKMAGFTGIF